MNDTEVLKKAFKKTSDKIKQHIPIACHLTDDIAILKSQDLIAGFELQGLLYESLENSELKMESEILDKIFTDVSKTNISIKSHLIRRKVNCHYDYDADTPFIEHFHSEYNEMLSSETTYRNQLFVMFVFRIPDLAKSISKFSFFKKNQKEKTSIYNEVLEDSIKQFNDVLHKFESNMTDYLPIRLGKYSIGAVDFSEIAEVYNMLLNFKYKPIPLREQNLDESIANSQLLFRHELGEVRYTDDSRFFTVLGIKDFPSQSFPKMFTPLLSAPFELNFTHSYERISNEIATEKLDFRQKQMSGAGDKATTLMKQLTNAIDQVASGYLSMGYCNSSLIVFGEDVKQLNNNVGEADHYFSVSGVTSVRENLGLTGQYLSQLPGNFNEELRSSLITSSNFSSFAPLYSHPYGQATANHWGDALMPVKTTANTLYNMNIHVEDVGSTNIFGMTGSGKTVLMGAMLIHSLKFGATHVILDKDRGLNLTVEAIGGDYHLISPGIETGWNPFSLELTPLHFQYLKDLIILLIDKKISTKEEDEIIDAIEQLYKTTEVDSLERNITGLLTFLSDYTEDSLANRLRKWSSEGEYSWMFSNTKDTLNFTKGSINGFDLTDIFDNEYLRRVAQHYLIYRARLLLDGSRVLLWIDEFWQYLKSQGFSNVSIDLLKTIRKQNGALITATQSPEDVANNANTDTFVTQTATNIYLPNTKANEQQYKEVFKMTDACWDYFKNLSKKSRKFVIQNELEYVRCSLDFTGKDQILTVLSATKKSVSELDKIKANHNGVLPNNWIYQLMNKSST